MKIINVGLSVLISMGLAISPIHANEFDATDESNEQSVVNNDDTSSNEEVDSNPETVQVQSISVSTEDNTTEYSLDENEVKNIKLVVTKIFTDAHTEQTTDYQYDIYATSSNLYLSNASGSLQNNVTYKGSDNEISVTKTSKGTGSFSVEVHVDELSNTCTLQFDGTNSVNVTLDANNGQFEDGTTTYTYKCDIGGEYISPAVIAPKGYSFVGWYDENDVEMHDHELKSDTTFFAKYKKICKVTFDAEKGQFKDGKKTCVTDLLEGDNPRIDYPTAPDGYFCTGWFDANGVRSNDIEVIADITFYAHYEKLYDVTFDAGKGHFEDGTHTYTIQPKYGYPQIYKDVVAPDGYKFVGWFDKNNIEFKEHLFTENTTYYAKYIKLFKVTYDAGKGQFKDGKKTYITEFSEGSYTHVDYPIAPEGYFCTGWYDENGEKYTYKDITSDTTFYAHYEKLYDVTFDAGKGHFEDGMQTYTIQPKYGYPQIYKDVIAPEGYKFVGWFDKNDVEYKEHLFTENTTYYAKYIKLFKVTYDAGNGHFEDGQNTVFVDVEEDMYPYYKEPVSPEGMMFIGWFDVDGNSYQKTTIKEDTTFYAKYGKTIHVTFDAGKGHFENGDKTKIVKTPEGVRVYGGSVISPDGMLFDGWYDENGYTPYGSDFKKDVTYYARYVKALTITFKANGGIGDTFTTTVGEGNYYSSENFDSKFTHPDGKVLIGFQDEETGQFYKLGYGYQFFNDATLLAQWADPVTVTLDCNGGTTSKGSLVQETWAKNTTLSHGLILDEKPVKEGMVFTGWHLDSIDGPKIDPHTISFDRDTVVYASYSKAIHININLDALGMESKSIEVAKGESVKLYDVCHVSVDEDKEITGYRIDGTNTIIDGNQELVFDKDINLTAVVKNKIKLTYDSNGAGFDSINKYVPSNYSNFYNVFDKTPKGKYFAGWATISPDGVVYTSATSGMPFTEDTTLYAVWKDGCTIHLDLGEGVSGTIQNGDVVKKGTSFSLNDIRVKQSPSGKKLAGWRIDEDPKVIGVYSFLIIDKDITVHAVWEDTITVTVKDPETDDVLYTYEIEKGTYFRDDYKIKKFLPKGKALFGWTLDKDKKDIISQYNSTFDKDVVLYPVYVDNVKITLDWGSEGKGYLNPSTDKVDMNTLECGKGLSIPYFDYTILKSPKGKALAGWRIDDTDDVISAGTSYTNSNYKVYKDTTLHAVWKDTVKITLNANGEKFANNQEIIEKEYIKNNELYSYNPQYPWEQKNVDGTKVITGWRVGSPDGPLMSKKLYNEFDSDTTYYAVWSDLITIRFENKGIKVAEYDNTYDWTLRNIYHLMVIEPNPSIINDFDDDAFIGWYNVETGDKLTEDTVFTKDCVFEAKTENRPIKIKLDYNGGTGKLNEVTTMSGYLTNTMLNDPYIEAPDNKLFLGWSLEKNGDILQSPNYAYAPFYFDKDTTLYAKYASEVTLTIHDGSYTFTEKVPMNEWMCFEWGSRCTIDGKSYYGGQSFKFTKDTDVYLYEGSGSSRVSISYRDITKLTGLGYGFTVNKVFMRPRISGLSITEDAGQEIDLVLDESFIPKGMKFDKWETVGGITIKDPTSKKTSFIMPKNELGKTYEIYATYTPRIPLQLEKDTLELNKGEKDQI